MQHLVLPAKISCGRASTAEQNADNQRLEIEQADYGVEYWFAGTVSGKVHAAQRKQFGDMGTKLTKNDMVVMAKLNRLDRDSSDVLANVRVLAAVGRR